MYIDVDINWYIDIDYVDIFGNRKYESYTHDYYSVSSISLN